MNIKDFKIKLKAIKNKGFIPSKRKAPQGCGICSLFSIPVQIRRRIKILHKKKKNVKDVFQLRYGDVLQYEDDKWEMCEEVLDKDEVNKILGSGW